MSGEPELPPPPPFDERIAYGPQPSQFFDVRRARENPVATVIAFHGGYWRVRYSLDHLGFLCAALAGAGFDVFSVEYRRLGEEGGGWPGTFDDVLAAVGAVAAPRPVLLGHSAGGQLALWAAKQVRDVAGVVALAPVADLALASRLRLSDGVADELVRGTSLEAVSPAHLAPLGARAIALHGDRDDVVPLALSRGFVAQASGAGDDARLEIVPGAGHYDLIDPRSAAFARVVEAVRSLSS